MKNSFSAFLIPVAVSSASTGSADPSVPHLERRVLSIGREETAPFQARHGKTLHDLGADVGRRPG
jgi:hypothetical protein